MTDTSALATAIRAARNAHTEFNAPSSTIVDVLMAASALGDLLAALSGVPERLAALETLYAHAWNFNDMHDDFTAALDALAAQDALAVLGGEGPA